jgi:plastocyanin
MLRRMSLFLMLAGAGILIGCNSTTTAGPDGREGPDTSNDLVIIMITGMDGDRAFNPAVATVRVGQSVAWRNNDTKTHRPILTAVFDTKQLAGGATSAPTLMTTPDTYEYKCTIHPSETGTVVVTP